MKTYLINCISSTAELIDAMVENATEIKYSELLQHVTQETLNKTFPMYFRTPVTLESDWSVSYYKGMYEGQECVYVDHSRIEYIFT